MTDTATARLGARQQSQGSNTNTWGDDKLNEAFRLMDRAMHGVESLAVTGDTTLSWTNYVATNTGQVAFLTLTGTLSSAAALIVPSVQWAWKGIANGTGQTITVRTAAGTGVTIPNGRQIPIKCDGSDCSYAGQNYLGLDITEGNNRDVVDYGFLTTYVPALITAASTNISGGFFTRYIYTASGGETSKSGADDNGQTLAYTIGAVEVRLNGANLISAVDYLAATGTSITGLTALTTGDVLEVVAFASFSVANTYTQAQVDALTTAAASSAAAAGPWQFVSSTAITAVSNIDFTGLVAGWDYLFSVQNAVPNSAAAAFRARLSVATVFDVGNNYGGPGTAPSAQSFIPITNATVNATAANGGVDVDILLRNPSNASLFKKLNAQPIYTGATNVTSDASGGIYFVAAAVDGIRLFFNGQNFQAVGRIVMFRRKNA